MLNETAIDRSPAATALPWRDPSLPVEERVADLLARMTLDEKIAQLYGIWVGADADGDGVAPHQHDLTDTPVDWDALIGRGLGQLTRPFGTAPVDPALGARALARTQAEIMAAGRHGVPALVHEECLTGFMAWGATVYPTPLAWGASFDPGLVETMAAEIGAAMRSVGIHQGLAPVLDVVRDYRWGRVEETIGEDPYLVGTLGAAYVKGLQSAGVIATLKHFAGYSASRAGRNFAPVSAGPRELNDVLLPPFEMAIREAGAGSVMHSYAEIDGVPSAANRQLLTTILRDEWGFSGTVVADYFGISFLRLLHRIAVSDGDAAGLALAAGVDVELPTVKCYGDPLTDAVRGGAVAEELVDRATTRVLTQKCELGLLDADWSPEPTALGHISGDGESLRGEIRLETPATRATARRLAEESVVLLHNDGTLPLRADARVAVIGPRADDAMAMLGCYAFPSHVGSQHPEVPAGVAIPSFLDALRAELPSATITTAAGCSVDGTETNGFDEAVAIARDADVCVLALGDSSGLFGRGTSGEGCDVADLTLPGVQGQLLDAVLATGTPVALVLVTGRPYALGAYAGRLAAAVQSFFPGEEGGSALAGVLSGRVEPSGRLPVSVPRTPGAQPGTYLTAPLGERTEVSSVDPTPLWAFGHGLSYTEFRWHNVCVAAQPVAAESAYELSTDGEIEISIAVTNTGDRAGTEVVQVYLHDPVAQVTRPDVRLIGYARVALAPGRTRRAVFRFSADLACFTGLDGRRIVEPGDLELRLSSASNRPRETVALRLVGPQRCVGPTRRLVTEARVDDEQ